MAIIKRRNVAMKRRTVIVAAVVGIANILILFPHRTKAANAPPAATAAPANNTAAATNPGPSAHQRPAPPPVQAGLHLDRQVPSPSGNLRVEYLRDRQHGIRQIALQDAHNPSNTTVLAQYKGNAWVVIARDDEWIVLNSRNGADSGAQLYHRVSAAPLKYEVPEELRGRGSELQDLVWQSYLSATQQDPNTDRRQVTIDATAWEPDAHKVSLSVAPIPAKDDSALPEPWTCMYDVTTKQIEPAPVVAGEQTNQPEESTPNEPAAAPWENGAAPEANATSSPAEETSEMEGEKFPATRQEAITIADANELELSDVRYAINEMFARHGANFKDAKTKKAFSAFSWYQPRADVTFDAIETEFSDVEKQNLAVLRRCREAKVAAARREARPIRGEPVDDESAGARAVRGILQGVSDALNGGSP